MDAPATLRQIFGSLLFPISPAPHIFTHVQKIIVILIFFIYFLVIFYTSVSPLIISIIFSILCAIIKTFIFLLSKLFNYSIDADESTEESFQERIPEGISPNTYHSRHLLSPSHGAIEQSALLMIQRGYDADEVFRLVQLVRAGVVDTNKSNVDINEPAFSTIEFHNKEYLVPLTRRKAERIFILQFPIYHIFLVLIFSFALSALYAYIRDSFALGSRWIPAFYLSLACYSMYNPPLVEPYSITVSNPSFSFTRPFYFTIIGLFFLIPHFTPTIIIYLFPILQSLNLISHPITFIKWLLECINRYAFGCDGISSFWTSFLDLIKNLAVMFLSGFCSDSVSISLGYFIALFGALLPTHLSLYNPTMLIRIAINLALFLIVAFLPKNEILEWVSLGLILLIEMIIPYMAANHQYIFFHFRILRFPIGWLKLICESIFVPLFIFNTTQKWVETEWMVTGLVLTHVANRSISEGHIVGLATIIWSVTFSIELEIKCSFIFALMLAEKLVRVMDRARLFDKWRSIKTHSIIEDIPWLEWVYEWLLKRVFSFDLIMKFPPFLWSLLTGSSSMLLLGVEPCAFYTGFRGTHIWQTSKEESELEHPFETPIYKSVSGWMERNIGKLVSDGTLGMVNGGDIFIFVSESVNMIVQFLEVGPGFVTIQMRGLEYSGQMSCHEVELNFVDNLIKDYGSFSSTGKLSLTYYDIRSLNIPMKITGAAKVTLDRALMGLDPPDLINWYFVAICYLLVGEEPSETPIECNLDSNQETIVNAFGCDRSKAYLSLGEIMPLFVDGWIDPAYLEAHFKDERIRLGTILAFMASAQLVDGFDECKELIEDVKDEDIKLMRVKGELCLVKPGDEEIEISALKLSRELVRGLWLNEAYSQLFLLNQIPERMSIQRSTRMLRNIINQACEHPIGYPAYTSEALVSTSSPLPLIPWKCNCCK